MCLVLLVVVDTFAVEVVLAAVLAAGAGAAAGAAAALPPLLVVVGIIVDILPSSSGLPLPLPLSTLESLAVAAFNVASLPGTSEIDASSTSRCRQLFCITSSAAASPLFPSAGAGVAFDSRSLTADEFPSSLMVILATDDVVAVGGARCLCIDLRPDHNGLVSLFRFRHTLRQSLLTPLIIPPSSDTFPFNSRGI
jgi:hypothetical protein